MGFLKMTGFNTSWMLLYENPLKRTGHLPFYSILQLRNPLDKPFFFFTARETGKDRRGSENNRGCRKLEDSVPTLPLLCDFR